MDFIDVLLDKYKEKGLEVISNDKYDANFTWLLKELERLNIGNLKNLNSDNLEFVLTYIVSSLPASLQEKIYVKDGKMYFDQSRGKLVKPIKLEGNSVTHFMEIVNDLKKSMTKENIAKVKGYVYSAKDNKFHSLNDDGIVDLNFTLGEALDAFHNQVDNTDNEIKAESKENDHSDFFKWVDSRNELIKEIESDDTTFEEESKEESYDKYIKIDYNDDWSIFTAVEIDSLLRIILQANISTMANFNDETINHIGSYLIIRNDFKQLLLNKIFELKKHLFKEFTEDTIKLVRIISNIVNYVNCNGSYTEIFYNGKWVQPELFNTENDVKKLLSVIFNY